MIRLCSNSPTRAKILKDFNIEFVQSPISFNEDLIEAKNPKSFVWEVVKGKLEEAKRIYDLDIPILVADTIVSANNKILRKAKDKEDAKEILLEQSGNEVKIITAMILKAKDFEFSDISVTKYIFKEFDKKDLEEYLNSSEWVGKAGACMVEGFCKKYIKEVIGLESNAMGLGAQKLIPWIEFLKEKK